MFLGFTYNDFIYIYIGPCFYIYSYITWFALMQMVKSFLVNGRMMIDEIIKYLVAIAYL